MTQEEIDVLESAQANHPTPDPTMEDRLAALESALLVLMGGACDV